MDEELYADILPALELPPALKAVLEKFRKDHQ